MRGMIVEKSLYAYLLHGGMIVIEILLIYYSNAMLFTFVIFLYPAGNLLEMQVAYQIWACRKLVLILFLFKVQ